MVKAPAKAAIPCARSPFRPVLPRPAVLAPNGEGVAPLAAASDIRAAEALHGSCLADSAPAWPPRRLQIRRPRPTRQTPPALALVPPRETRPAPAHSVPCQEPGQCPEGRPESEEAAPFRCLLQLRGPARSDLPSRH